MATMSDNRQRVFVDTNVLVYATQESAPFNRPARQKLKELEDSGSEFWISRQVLREYIATMSRPQTYSNPLSIETIVERIRLFEQIFMVADDTVEVTAHLLTLLEETSTGGKQVHDANIAATMLAYGIDTLLTANVDDFKRFEDKITLVSLVEAAS
jgi:predicted nucleic acid-binding protein